MNDWLSIGQFANRVGVSAKALRLYEDMGILKSHTRGENGYRYYHQSQLSLALRLKEFKDLGFSLEEIKELLHFDEKIDTEKIKIAMSRRLQLVIQQSEILREQRSQIESILSSLDEKSKPLKAEDRRVIMSLYGKVSIVITGVDGLEKTALYTQKHFKSAGQEIGIFKWQEGMELPKQKPYILIVPEKDLASQDIEKICADVIVIKNISSVSESVTNSYLNLYTNVAPHMNTVINADDRASVDLVKNQQIRKTRYLYFSKNKALAEQIKNIGGVISDGEELEIYGFNLQKKVRLKLERIFPFEDEIGLLSSLAAVMTVGFNEEQLVNC